MKPLNLTPKTLTDKNYNIPTNDYGHFQITAHPLDLVQNNTEKYLQIIKSNTYTPTARAIALWLYEWSRSSKPKFQNQVYHVTSACQKIYEQRAIRSFLWYDQKINVTSNFWHGLHTSLRRPSRLTLQVMKKRSTHPNALSIIKLQLNFSLFGKNTKVFVQQRFTPQEIPVVEFTYEQLKKYKLGQLLLRLLDKHSKQLDKLAITRLNKYLRFRTLVSLLGISLGISNFAIYTPQVLGRIFAGSKLKIVQQGGHKMVSWSIPAKFDLEKTVTKVKQSFTNFKDPQILELWPDIYNIIKDYYFNFPLPPRMWMLLYQRNNLALLLNWLKTKGELTKLQLQQLNKLLLEINSQLLLKEYMHSRKLGNNSYFVNLEPNDANNNFIILKQDNLPIKIKCNNKTFSATLRVEL